MTAQFPTDVPYTSIATPPATLPALNASIEDNSVPDAITITRITDYVTAWNWYPHHEYAKIQPWNADATLYKFYSTAIYDAVTHQLLYEIQNAGSIYPTYWSNTNADILYGFMENGDIKTYTVSSQQVNTVGHIYLDEATQTNYDLVKMGPGEGNIDKNDHFVAFVGQHGVDMDIIIYNLQTNTVLYRQTFAGAWGNNASVPEYVDWVSVSQSGDFVGIMWNHNTTSSANPFNGHYGVEIYNTSDMQFLRRIADYGNHGDFGYAQNGDEVLVQFWGPTGTVNMYYLDRMERVVLHTTNDFAGEGHISCRNLNRPGWAYISQDEPARSGQILAIKLDNSGLVEHYGHHFSTSSTYKKSPMPVPSPNGDKIMFKSDFGDATTVVVYTFEATKSNASNIEKNTESNFLIYPNPVENTLEINGNDKIKNITITNYLGQIVQKTIPLNAQNIQINVQNLASGTYIINIQSAMKTTRKVFVKR